MARTSKQADAPAVITAAPHPRSLDVETRQKRYLYSMAFRTVAFIGAFFVPGVWLKVACVAFAVAIPPVAVLLANNADNHKEPPLPDNAAEVPVGGRALTTGHVIRGDVVEDA